MTARSIVGTAIRVLGSAKLRLVTATTTSFDFGTPNDLFLPAVGCRSGDRVIVVFDAASSANTAASIEGELDALDALIATADADVGAPSFTAILAAMEALHTSAGALLTEGSTDTVSFVVQDANDVAGAFGTAATAITDGVLTGGVGNQRAVTGVQLQSSRPWLRCRATSTGTTDTFDVSCTVLAFPRRV